MIILRAVVLLFLAQRLGILHRSLVS